MLIPPTLYNKLHTALEAQDRACPGDGPEPQPVHVLYGGAHLFQPDAVAKMGALARKAMEHSAPDFVTFGRALGLLALDEGPNTPEDIALVAKRMQRLGEAAREQHPALWVAHAAYARVVEKLAREPVEDMRLDFEDGYGPRSDAEEDEAAREAGRRVARAWEAGALPKRIGVRIKPFTRALLRRSTTTLDLFVSAMLEETRNALPSGFVVTLSKVTLPEQVRLLAGLLDDLEDRHSLARGAIKVELMVESPQALATPEGALRLPSLVRAARGRCQGVHLGAYDYSAECDVVAAHQTLGHPSCDSARSLMKLSLAGTGVWMSDGATNAIPVGPHRGEGLSFQQRAENRAKVHAAWRLHYENVRRALTQGVYQGWDLHPAQLPARYAAVFVFFVENLAAMTQRLRQFLDKAAQASLVGSVFDDAATGQGLLNFFLRGLACGALSEADVERAGLSRAELGTRSFAAIVEGRRGAPAAQA